MTEEGYLQNKIREQQDQINNLTNKIKTIDIMLSSRLKQLNQDKEFFQSAFNALNIKEAAIKSFDNAMQRVVSPVLSENKRVMDTNMKALGEMLITIELKLNLALEINTALMTVCLRSSKDKEDFAKFLREMDTKKVLETFSHYRQEAKTLFEMFNQCEGSMICHMNEREKDKTNNNKKVVIR